MYCWVVGSTFLSCFSCSGRFSCFLGGFHGSSESLRKDEVLIWSQLKDVIGFALLLVKSLFSY